MSRTSRMSRKGRFLDRNQRDVVRDVHATSRDRWPSDGRAVHTVRPAHGVGRSAPRKYLPRKSPGARFSSGWPLLKEMSSPPDPPSPTPLPLHLLAADDPETGVVIRRRPGRPKKVVVAPTVDQLAYDEQVAELRRRHLQGDPLLAALTDGQPGAEVIHETMVGIARESAALRVDRERAEREGRDIALIATRRIEALGRLASIVLGLKKLGVDEFLASPGMIRKIVEVWLREVAEIVHETVPSELGEVLMKRYEERLRGDPELGGDASAQWGSSTPG